MIFYHIDSQNCWKPGDIILPSAYWGEDYKTQLLVKTACSALFPDGVCAFGARILARCDNIDCMHNEIMEWILENVRRSLFPHLPSRFSSLFASVSTKAVEQWYAKIGSDASTSQLLEVECDSFCIGDALFLDCVNQNEKPDSGLYSVFPAECVCHARRYWETMVVSGQSTAYIQSAYSAFALPEVLLVPPIRVLRRIDP